VPYILPSGIVNGAGVPRRPCSHQVRVASVFGVNIWPPPPPWEIRRHGPRLWVASPPAIGRADVAPLFRLARSDQLPVAARPCRPVAQTLTVSAPGQPDVEQVISGGCRCARIFLSSVADGGDVRPGHSPRWLSRNLRRRPRRPGKRSPSSAPGFGQDRSRPPRGFAVPALPVYFLTDPVTVQSAAFRAPYVHT